ncbi:MAG: respiratory nitrate reductase subunit gamma [Quinella sp. 3Q1]|nr:respiratory nitrate reductase subunit gamma [Quinella sp. 3Q1]MBR3050251.1 respiratory nitrate reductase subunit gamma [Selenomonadaceae bacterium]MBR6888628.1 respiratory nitrate reductase subunit gamma [Selenomonadaceae bacterium]
MFHAEQHHLPPQIIFFGKLKSRAQCSAFIFLWQKSLTKSLVSDAPIIFKCHVLCAMATIIIFPFTRLVHCLSFPFEYFMRSNIIYRRK